jgi:hypothetical protein
MKDVGSIIYSYILYNNFFPIRLVNSLLERYKDTNISTHSTEDGERLEQKQKMFTFSFFGK